MQWVLIAIMFWAENQYFGWNAKPKSDAEMVCDLMILGVAAIVCAIH
jgi:hypothetical protein